MSKTLSEVTNRDKYYENLEQDLTTYNKNGLTFFKNEPILSIIKFAADHLNCDFVVMTLPDSDEYCKIVAYAESEDANEKLAELSRENSSLCYIVNPLNEEEGVSYL